VLDRGNDVAGRALNLLRLEGQVVRSRGISVKDQDNAPVDVATNVHQVSSWAARRDYLPRPELGTSRL